MISPSLMIIRSGWCHPGPQGRWIVSGRHSALFNGGLDNMIPARTSPCPQNRRVLLGVTGELPISSGINSREAPVDLALSWAFAHFCIFGNEFRPGGLVKDTGYYFIFQLLGINPGPCLRKWQHPQPLIHGHWGLKLILAAKPVGQGSTTSMTLKPLFLKPFYGAAIDDMVGGGPGHQVAPAAMAMSHKLICSSKLPKGVAEELHIWGWLGKSVPGHAVNTIVHHDNG